MGRLDSIRRQGGGEWDLSQVAKSARRSSVGTPLRRTGFTDIDGRGPHWGRHFGNVVRAGSGPELV